MLQWGYNTQNTVFLVNHIFSHVSSRLWLAARIVANFQLHGVDVEDVVKELVANIRRTRPKDLVPLCIGALQVAF